MTMKTLWYWRGLHLLCALMIPLILVFVLGCIKAKEEKANLGPEVPADEIDLALSKAIHGANTSGTALGQFVNYSVVRRLENQETTINMGYTRVSVFAKKDLPTETEFSLRIEQASRNADNSFEMKVSQDILRVTKAPLVPSAWDRGELNASAISARAAIAKKPTKVSFHRLREWDDKFEVPPAVQAKADCGGLSPCELPVRYVAFDLVQWFNDESYQKITLDFAFSTKTPYLPFGQDFDRLNGILVSDCRATVVPVEKTSVYVRDCLSLEDFQK